MFNWRLFMILIVICLPGIVLVVPRSLAAVQGLLEKNLKPGQSVPPFPMLVFLAGLQATVLVSLAAALGVATMSRTELSAPFLEGLAAGRVSLALLAEQLWPALWGGVVAALPFLFAYYGYFRPNLDETTVTVTEALRAKLGFWGRLFYGGIYEEVLVRWGLMGLFAWLGSLLVGEAHFAVIWSAILLSGLLFAYGHLPGSYAAGAQKSTLLLAATLALNGWAALVFGYLFWQVGLTAAILAHMLLHLAWYPLERRYQAAGAARAAIR